MPTPRWMPRGLRLAALALSAACSLPSLAQVGLQRESWTLANADAPADVVVGMVWYPTDARSEAQRFGPFQLHAALGATPSPGRHPLVLISHGNGGTELGHAWLAEALAAAGHVVIAIRHPGSNYQDMSATGRAVYFTERPRHLSRVLDQVLAGERWGARIDATRIAAIGTSAGGHTVLALAGARPEPARALRHCSLQGEGLSEDPTMCLQGGFTKARPAPAPDSAARPVDRRDPRIRAVVADVPLVMGLAAESLREITVPLLVQYGARDDNLVPRFHAEALCRALPQATCVRDERAGHFAIFQSGTGPLGKPGLDPAADPEGFDRAAWQAAAGPRIVAFLGRALR